MEQELPVVNDPSALDREGKGRRRGGRRREKGEGEERREGRRG